MSSSSPRQTPLRSALKHHNYPSPSSSPSSNSTSFKEEKVCEQEEPIDQTSRSAKSSNNSSIETSNSNTVTFEAGKKSNSKDDSASSTSSAPWVMVENVDEGKDAAPSIAPTSSSKDSKDHHHHHHHLGFFHRHPHPASSPSTAPSTTSSSRHPSRPSSPNPSTTTSTIPSTTTLPPTYERKVGFDTMPDADDTVSHTFSFTLQARSKGYRRSNNTRTFMCAVDGNTYSERALEWLVEELVEDGDEVVALRVLEGEAEEIDQDEAREEARDLLASIVDLNEEVGDRKISIIVEFIAGRTTSTIIRLIHMYRPDSLTVGTRGKSTNAIQRVLGGPSSMGSVSRDVLSRSPVPVVVVRPTAKVRKHLKKRQADPKRRSYHDLIRLAHQEHTKSSGSGSHNLAENSSSISEISEERNLLPMSVSRSKRESLLNEKNMGNMWGITEGLKSGVGHLGKVGSGVGGVKLSGKEEEKK